MNYHQDFNEFTIGVLKLCELLDALPKVIKEELWNYYVLNRHHKTIKDKIVELMDIWNNPD